MGIISEEVFQTENGGGYKVTYGGEQKKSIGFTFNLKLKNCERVFDEELGPGVLAQQKIEFPITKEEAAGNVMFLKALWEAQRAMVDEYIEVEVIEEE